MDPDVRQCLPAQACCARAEFRLTFRQLTGEADTQLQLLSKQDQLLLLLAPNAKRALDTIASADAASCRTTTEQEVSGGDAALQNTPGTDGPF